MFELKISDISKSMSHISSFLQAMVGMPNRAFDLDVSGYDSFKELVSDFSVLCEKVSMQVTASSLGLLASILNPLKPDGAGRVRIEGADFNNIRSALESVTHCFANESPLKIALIIRPENAWLLNPPVPLFGVGVNSGFSSLTYEMEEAGKCLALGRSTASVFHLMRIMEGALKAVHNCLGISVALEGANRNWGSILVRIKNDISTRGSRWAEKEYFNEVYARLDAIKDAWRNSTMHVENKYTEEEAKIIFEYTRAFMQKIAARMDEAGLPFAVP